MNAPWMTQGMHQMMHLPRADRVIATGVIEPYWTRFVSPVDIARHEIDPFIASVRGPGPQVVPTPDPNSIAAAAQAVAAHFNNGQAATISVGGQQVTVSIDSPAMGGLIGVIQQAAQSLANGQAVAVQVGPYKVIIMPPDGTASNTDAASGITTDSNVTASPSGFGDAGNIPMDVVLPSIPQPIGLRQLPWAAQGAQWRDQLYTDNNAAYRTMQQVNASLFAPFAVQRATNLATQPVQWAQGQPVNALSSRSIPARQAHQNMNRVMPRFAMTPGGTAHAPGNPQPGGQSNGFGCPGIKQV